MAEQDDPTTVGNVQLAIQAALLEARTVTVGRVLAYREIGPNLAPVVDVQISPQRIARSVEGQESETMDIAPLPNVPVAFFQCGQFTIKTHVRPGQHVLLIICDRELGSWMQGDGSNYRPGFPGQHHNINDAVAMPFLTPEQFQPGVRPTATQLFIGDRTGEVATIELDSAAGNVTVKGAATVNVQAPAVTLGSVGAVAPIARVGIDVCVVPGIGTIPITPGGVPSAHKVQG